MDNKEKLSFRISSGLKNIIGRELISDKYIAIFELVKNSYDAGAELVTISYLQDDKGVPYIMITDDGRGMTYSDVVNKWLFVAYSEKKEKNRPDSYKDHFKRGYAGAKGIGRFSCDRLGSELNLYTKVSKESIAHVLNINWNQFEIDDEKEFVKIKVDYYENDALPNKTKHGTVLVIKNLREEWSRFDLLNLKRSLMKLISPNFDKGTKPFEIEIIAPSEQNEDALVQSDPKKNSLRDTVNGRVYNDILEKLNLKTTNIDVGISEDGEVITTKLSDRGDYIFTLKERNRNYLLLKNIHISLYFLNRAAKVSFTTQMGGVQPVKYGSIFVYRNGFRVNPYGEPGQDLFGIDRRKAQGWKRFLGTRELMGQISIHGDNDSFTETSSRAHGFVRTPALDCLEEFFVKKVLVILERYVVNLIAWGEPLKKENGRVITAEEVSDEIVSQFITNASLADVLSIDYNKEIFVKNSHASYDVHSNIERLEQYAQKTEDEGFRQLAKAMKANAKALLQLNKELDQDNREKDQKIDALEKENEARQKQVFFLNNSSSQDVNNLMNGMHAVYTLADANCGNLDYALKLLNKLDCPKNLLDVFSDIRLVNMKIRKVADLAFHGNQTLENQVRGDISDYIQQYVETQLESSISIEVHNDDKTFVCVFDPSSVGIIVDNVFSNSLKNEAKKVEIYFRQEKRYTYVSFVDDGLGLTKKDIADKLFERGFSLNPRKKGFGMGLAEVKCLVEEMKGCVSVDADYIGGFKLDVRLNNE